MGHFVPVASVTRTQEIAMITGEGKALPLHGLREITMLLIFAASFFGALVGSATGILLGSWVLF